MSVLGKELLKQLIILRMIYSTCTVEPRCTAGGWKAACSAVGIISLCQLSAGTLNVEISTGYLHRPTKSAKPTNLPVHHHLRAVSVPPLTEESEVPAPITHTIVTLAKNP